jgi:hypothetical protein
MKKRHLINRSGNDSAAGVSRTRNRAAQINQVHDVTSQHIAQQIGGAG